MNPKQPMKFQRICATNSGGKKITRYARGRTNKELKDDITFKLNNKLDKQFSAAVNRGSNLCFPDERVFFNKYILKGVHAQMFLKNCNYEFTKWQHIDIMCMLKSKFNKVKMALMLFTSPKNLQNLLNQIFKILGVADILQALARLHIC